MWQSAPNALALLLALTSVATAQVVPSLDPFQPVPQGNASFLTDTQNWLTNELYQERNELECDADIIVHGCLGPTAAGLTHTPTSCVAYAGGYRVTEIGNITYPDNSICTVVVNDGITSTPGGNWVRVGSTHYLINCLDAAPAPPPANSALLMQVTTHAGSITIVQDIRHLVPSCGVGGGNVLCGPGCTPGSVSLGIGPDCMIECVPNPCVPNPCPNNAACVVTNTGGFVCSCASTTTTIPTNACIPNPCLNGGVCVLGGAGGIVCLCPCNFCGDHCESLCGTTTTTSAPTTTTGAGSTTTGPATTTTSTTIPLLPSTTFLALPNYPTDEVDAQWATGKDQVPVCARVLNGIPMVNATKMASYITHACGSFQSYNVGIYPDADGGTFIARTQFACDSTGMHSSTGIAAFSLPSNTVYRLCICASNIVNFGVNAGYLGAHWKTNGGFASTLSAFVPASVGYAANLCGTTAPTTTGAITPDATLVPPLVWVSAE